MSAFMSKKLGTIVKDVPLEESLDDFKKVDYDYEKLSELYRELDVYKRQLGIFLTEKSL